ncbi:MAG: glycosyltransferase family 4 protein, partial [Acidobacteriia bacterium]|nr:glycosyltransferase family 4 protein [Terriglobia bacterium]
HAAGSRPKVAIVASHPIQHFCPLYRMLAKSGAMELKVFFGSTSGLKTYWDPAFNASIRWDMDLVGGYEWEFVAGADKATPAAPVPASDVAKRLDHFAPDLVQISGAYHPISRAAYFWAIRNRKRILYFSDSENQQRRSWLTLLRKQLTLRPLFSQVDAFLTIGDSNEAYYRSYGVRAAKLFRSPYPIDSPEIERARADRERHQAEIRKRLEIPQDALLAITVGKLIARKRPRDVIEAAMALDRKPAVRRVIVALLGDGPDRAELEKLLESGRAECVRLPGFIGVGELPAFYAAADLLIHAASADPHPLAIGEAITAGLPIVVSNRVGCIGPSDDVREGRNGLVYPCGDIVALENALRKIADNDALRRKMAAASVEIARDRALSESARGFVAAVAAVSAA